MKTKPLLNSPTTVLTEYVTYDIIEFIEEIYSNGYAGEIIKAKKDPDLNLFSTTELRVLASVAEDFKDCNAKEITEFSHRKEAYLNTKNGDIISYKYANRLNYV